MEFKVWIYYLFTEILMAITPGPAIILVSSQSIKYGIKSSFFGSFGVSSGNLLFFILSACGVGGLILAAGNLFQYIKICGALFLIYSGFMTFYKSFKAQAEFSIEVDNKKNNSKSFIQGFIAETSNPKAIIFFIAVIPMFIDESKNVVIQLTIMALTTIIIETFVLMFYGWISLKGKRKILRNNNTGNWQDKLAGITLIVLGFNLFFSKLQ